MTTLSELRVAVYARFKAEWAGRTPHVFDNRLLDPQPPEGFVRLSVRNLAGSGQETMGACGQRKFLRPARAFLQAFLPISQGASALDDVLQAGRRLFEGRALPPTDARVYQVDVRELGEVEDGRWWSGLVEARIEYDETL